MRVLLLAAALALASAGVYALDPYLGFLLAQLAILVIAVLALNLLGNVAGMLSLANAAFMGLGGYGVLVALTLYGVPLIVGLPLTAVIGYAVGWLIGIVAVRLSGISLAIVTFGFVQVFQVFAKQGGPWSGDGYGLVTPPLTIPLLGAVTPSMTGGFCIVAAGVTALLTARLTRSRIGRAWAAIKEHPLAAEMQGIDLLRMRAAAFAISGALAGFAGALQAVLLGITNPNLYTVDASISQLAMMVVGGSTGSVAGPVFGPAVLFLVPEYFDLGSFKEIFYGVALLATLALAPRGLEGLLGLAGRIRARNAR